ncbi:hypothetical protein GCM10010309_19980 [Streptomyces violaceochromogenes]|nr:hypothetical protein GCM10010309_19980 [Streptomyces violaceochromogenes]
MPRQQAVGTRTDCFQARRAGRGKNIGRADTVRGSDPRTRQPRHLLAWHPEPVPAPSAVNGAPERRICPVPGNCS